MDDGSTNVSIHLRDVIQPPKGGALTPAATDGLEVIMPSAVSHKSANVVGLPLHQLSKE